MTESLLAEDIPQNRRPSFALDRATREAGHRGLVKARAALEESRQRAARRAAGRPEHDEQRCTAA